MNLRLFIKLVLLPPGSILLLLLLSCGLLALGRKKLGQLLLLVSLLGLYALSAPVTSYLLSGLVETHPVIDNAILSDPKNSEALKENQAVVVLAGGLRADTIEFGGPSVGPNTLWRTRYGVWVSKALDLPLMMSGGTPTQAVAATADLMAQVAEQEFLADVKWVEGNSRTTWESALAAEVLLSAENISKIILVTDAWHMPRSVAAFEQVGFEVKPAPTLFFEWEKSRPAIFGFLPNAGALHYNAKALHEIIGLAWYRFRYFK